jgi:serine protease Do
VDAPFQAGDSGSPVFDVTTRQVIGVATYHQTWLLDVFGNLASTTTRNNPAVKQENRWFGYRIDSVANWESIDLTQWQRQFKRVEAFRDVCLALRSCALAQFAAAKAADPHLGGIIAKYESQPNWVDIGTSKTTTLSKPSAELIRNFFQEVHAYAGDGTKEFGSEDYYDYFQTSVYAGNNVGALVKYREQEIKAFEEADANLDSYRAKLNQ